MGRPHVGAHSEWSQPWSRVEIADRRGHLQILDPGTAFEIEPKIMDAIGDASSLAIVAPGEIGQALLRSAGMSASSSLDNLANEAVGGPLRAVALMRTAGDLVVSMLVNLGFADPTAVKELFRALVLDRLMIGDSLVADARDWSALSLGPRWKWHAMAMQVRQTFGPLWTRSPYKTRCPDQDDGVPPPVSVPVAVGYAANLARLGYASSADDVLRSWTPVRMIEVIESAAYTAERERAAQKGPG